ncbi:MAG: HAD family hydrolase [Alphaproteobacteria bacterium]|nr:HAD family hydrolase [Alphaproteobacteria bacterium]
MALAFFDFDLTLISRNSGGMWVRSELEGGHLRVRDAARAALWMARYRLGSAELTAVMLEAIAALEGQAEAELQRRFHDFYDDRVAGLFRPGALEAVEAHRAAGDHLVMLTGSSSYLAERAAAQLGLDEVLCTRFEVDDLGRFTGRPAGPIGYGPGKLEMAEALLQRLGVELSQCTFYTDSYSDRPVLDLVGRPVAVNPDPRLRRLAREAGWEVLDWGEP